MNLKRSPYVKPLLLSLLYAAVLTVSESVYRRLFQIPDLEKLPETLLIVWLFVLLFVFAKTRLMRGIIAGFFLLSVLANNVHYAIYQSWITGMNYYLMFAEFREVGMAGGSMVNMLWLPVVWALAEAAVLVSIRFWLPETRTRYAVADGLFAVLILFIIVRSFSTSHGQGIAPDSGYSRLKAHYFSFGYFVGRITPYQWFDLSKVPAYETAEPKMAGRPKVRNIILIMGESESAANVQFFGYPRETTPFFKELAEQQPQTVIRPIYSAGKMTFISLPMFFNAIARPNGFVQINKGSSNLFRLAQEQGFQTAFHSSQPESEMELVNLVGRKWMDTVTYPTDVGRAKNQGMDDMLLLSYLQRSDLSSGSRFIVLNQRGSHIPYAQYLPEQNRFFKNGTPLDNYDSTIRHTDEFIRQVFTHLSQQPQQDWLLIYTSDHGQYVTDKVFNQGTNEAAQYTVPLMIYSPDAAVQQRARDVFLSCGHQFHQQLSLFLLEMMGYDRQPETGCSSGTVTNNMLTGEIGWIEIDETGKRQEVMPK